MNRKGFTLVELLAVIVILAILMVSAGAGVMATMNNSKVNTFKNEALTAIDGAKNMYSEISMNMQNSSEFLKASENSDYAGMCVTLSGLVNNGYLDKDIITYGGVILVEVPYDGGETLYNIWMHNSQYGINGIEKNYINKLKFKKDNNTGATDPNGGGLGIVTELKGIFKYTSLAHTGTSGESIDNAKGNNKGASGSSGGAYKVTIKAPGTDRGGTGQTYTDIKCINAQLN